MLSTLEAVTAGCQPLIPDRLAYPELFAKCFRYPSCESDPAREVIAIASRLEAMAIARENSEGLIAPDVGGLCWKVL